jgi:hypothetical protein
MGSNEILLGEAPESFFDPEKWSEFLGFYASRQAALQQISQPEPHAIVWVRRLAADVPEGGNARWDEHVSDRGNELVSAFKVRLIKGDLIATGLCSLAIGRVMIPSERWPDLWPNFAEDRADGKDLKFTNVRVSKLAKSSARTTADLFDECVAWMEQRDSEGENRRKILEGEALKRFGSALTTRMFATIYKSVFDKPRGRPRKTGPK